jgi:hypothetical protein
MKIPIDACRPLGLSGWPDPTRLVFPEPTGIDVNMMPFDMGSIIYIVKTNSIIEIERMRQ